MPVLSIIIPIYKVEPYLKECVDSVIKQQLDDYEIILVDDGSPDACPQICDDYASQYPFVRAFHKLNGGLSSARNVGLKESMGKYVMFLDSDDWWNPDISVQDILEVVKQHRDTEMFVLACLSYIAGSGYYQRIEYNKLDGVRTDTVEHYYYDLIQNGNLEVSACTKVIRRDFLIDNGLFFREGITSEDTEWMIRLLRSLKRVFIINVPLYIYRSKRTGSITNSIGVKNLNDLLGIINNSIAFYDSQPLNLTIKPLELCYCSYLWFCALGLSATLSRQDFKNLFPLFRQTRCVCRYSKSPKTKLANAVSSIMGVRAAKCILGAYLWVKSSMNLRKKKVTKS